MAENQPYFELNLHRDADADYEVIKKNQEFAQKSTSDELTYIEQEIEKLSASLETLSDDEKSATEREIKRLKIQRNQTAIKGNSNFESFDKDPDTYIALYSIQHAVEEGGEAKAHLTIGENDALKLKIEMLQPISANIDIVDGKVQFSPEGMTPDKMHDMVAFLERHGIVADIDNLKLENADEETHEVFDEAVQQFEEEQEGKPQIFSFSAYSEDGVEEDYEEIPGSSYDPADELREHMFDDVADENTSVEKTKEEKEEEEESYGLFGGKAPKPVNDSGKNAKKDFDQSVTKWMNKNKRKGFSWFDGSTFNGWDTFTCYPGENTKQDRTPITIDHKTGAMKYNYEFKVYTRMKNGHLEVCFSLPPGKNLTDDQAYMITSALKDAGVKYVQYGKDMTDTNEAILRTACAKRLLVPTDHKIDFDRYDKMIEAAGKKVDNNSKDLFRYKYDLAMQMDKNLRKKGVDYTNPANKNNPDCRRIRWAVGAYQLHPFRDLWEDFGLRGDYEKRLAEGTPGDPKCTDPKIAKDGAKKVIGAKMAVGSLYDMFSDNAGQDVAYLLSKDCKSLNDKEKGVLQTYIDNNGLSKETLVHDMPPAALRAIYAEMCNTQEAKVKKDIEKEYLEILRSNKQNGSKDDPEKGAIREVFGRADTYIQNMNEELKDSQLSPIFLTKKAMPKHDFTQVREEAIAEGLIRTPSPRTSAPRNSGRNGAGGR